MQSTYIAYFPTTTGCRLTWFWPQDLIVTHSSTAHHADDVWYFLGSIFNYIINIIHWKKKEEEEEDLGLFCALISHLLDDILPRS